MGGCASGSDRARHARARRCLSIPVRAVDGDTGRPQRSRGRARLESGSSGGRRFRLRPRLRRRPRDRTQGRGGRGGPADQRRHHADADPLRVGPAGHLRRSGAVEPRAIRPVPACVRRRCAVVGSTDRAQARRGARRRRDGGRDLSRRRALRRQLGQAPPRQSLREDAVGDRQSRDPDRVRDRGDAACHRRQEAFLDRGARRPRRRSAHRLLAVGPRESPRGPGHHAQRAPRDHDLQGGPPRHGLGPRRAPRGIVHGTSDVLRSGPRPDLVGAPDGKAFWTPTSSRSTPPTSSSSTARAGSSSASQSRTTAAARSPAAAFGGAACFASGTTWPVRSWNPGRRRPPPLRWPARPPWSTCATTTKCATGRTGGCASRFHTTCWYAGSLSPDGNSSPRWRGATRPRRSSSSSATR